MQEQVKIHFLGASGTVTGSKFLIETTDKSVLVDCGVFQGLKELRLLNWNPLPVDVPSIDMVLLTHGHLDHVGYLPLLVKQGFSGKVVGTAPTLAIAEIILFDSAKIHEEEAEKANAEDYSSHHPAMPLYTVGDVEKTIKLFKAEVEDKWVEVSDGMAYRFQYNGHIIGATFIEVDIKGKRFVFSGDIGRRGDYLLDDPKRPERADYLFVESTYGNRMHPEENIEEIFSAIIKETLYKRGTLIIPSFAVERLQTLIYILWQMQKKKKIPDIPIFIDSPMGENVLKIFERFPKWHKLSLEEYLTMSKHVNIVQSYKETWETIDTKTPKIVIAGSGMVTGGRVLTYLQQLIDEPTTTVLLVGYQAEGTRGRQLVEGASEIRFFGKYYPVKATVKQLESLSAHADQKDLLHWMSALESAPEKVYLIHGEPTAADTLRVKLKHVYGWNATIPKLGEVETIQI